MARQHLLPKNATAIEKAVSESLDRTPELEDGIDAIRSFKYDEPAASVLPWLVLEYGLGPVSRFFDDLADLIEEGIAWQRLIGTPAALTKSLEWIGYDAITLYDAYPTRRMWHRFQIDMGKVPAIELPVLMDAEYLGGLSSPARSVFYRGFHGYDVGALEWGDGRWGDMLWGDDSGVRLPGGTVKWSHGEDDAGVVDLTAEQQEALGLTLSGGWDPIPWDAPGQAWGQVTDMPALQSYLLRRLPMRMGYFDDEGEAIGYRRPIAVRDVTGDHEPGGTTIHVEVEARTGFGDGVDPVSGEGADAASMAVVARAGNADPAKPGKLWLQPPELAVEDGYDLADMTLPSVPVDFKFRRTVRQHGIIRVRSLAAYGAGTPAGEILGDAEPAGFAVSFAHDIVLVRWPGHGQFLGTIDEALDAGILVSSAEALRGEVGSDRLLKQVSRRWRLQHDAMTGQPLGYLPDPARSNLCPYSEQLDHASWGASPALSVIKSADVAIAPDGMLSADKIAPSAENNAHKFYRTFTGAVNTTYTASVFVKAAGCGEVWLELGNTAFLQAYVTVFNLATRTIVAGSTAISAGIEEWGNGWFRIWVVGTSDADGGNYVIAIRAQPIGIGHNSSFLGDGTAGIYAWGVQVEAGAFPTSYIPTGSGVVARAADWMYADLTKLPFDPAEYTMFVTAQPSPDAVLQAFRPMAIHDGSPADNGVWFENKTVGTKNFGARVYSATSLQANLSTSAGEAAERFKAALAVKANDFEFVHNGAAFPVDASGAVPVAPTRLYLGTLREIANHYSAPVESAGLIPRRMPRASLQQRTNPGSLFVGGLFSDGGNWWDGEAW